MTVCIIVGNNRPRLYASFAAAQGLGGVPVPAYQDPITAELQYVIAHFEARFAIVEDQEQLDKILKVRTDCPNIEFIIYDEARGVSGDEAEGLLSLDDPLARGRRWRLANIESKDVQSLEDLAELPVLRKADLISLQAECPPFADSSQRRAST